MGNGESGGDVGACGLPVSGAVVSCAQLFGRIKHGPGVVVGRVSAPNRLEFDLLCGGQVAGTWTLPPAEWAGYAKATQALLIGSATVEGRVS